MRSTEIETKYAKVDPAALKIVESLPGLKNDVAGYREAMQKVGEHLAKAIKENYSSSLNGDICVVCTVEDADFLAKGLIKTLESYGYGNQIKLICLWNDRINENGVSIAPIFYQYKEEFTPENVSFIILKSIISGACVVKTNLRRVLSFAKKPQAILVASPVMLKGAEAKLKSEFPADVSKEFKFIHYSTHTRKDGGSVVPGIGGSVYELLGFENSSQKNSYIPGLVKERRERQFAHA